MKKKKKKKPKKKIILEFWIFRLWISKKLTKHCSIPLFVKRASICSQAPFDWFNLILLRFRDAANDDLKKKKTKSKLAMANLELRKYKLHLIHIQRLQHYEFLLRVEQNELFCSDEQETTKILKTKMWAQNQNKPPKKSNPCSGICEKAVESSSGKCDCNCNWSVIFFFSLFCFQKRRASASTSSNYFLKKT